LLTDFGIKDTYVSEMKGNILSISPSATIIDLTHNIPMGNIRSAIFNLERSINSFPKDTVFCCVVDPEVGSERAPLMGHGRNYFFVGPDNGILSPFFPPDKVYRIPKTWRKETPGKTFDGRDLFSIAAAKIDLEKGFPSYEIIKSFTSPINTKLQKSPEVIWIDIFGNAILLLKKDDFTNPLKWGRFKFDRLFNSYDEIQDDYGLVIGSSGYIEVAGKRRNAAEDLNLKRGDHLNV